MKKVFKGTTHQCFKHLMRAIEGPNFFDLRAILADFCQVGEQTIRRWVATDTAPIGMPQLRLRYYLEFLGYHVTESDKVVELVRDAGRIIAFGLIDAEEFGDLVGYHNHRESSYVLSVLRGEVGLSEERRTQYEAAIALYADDLAQKQRATKRIAHVDRAEQEESEREATRERSQPVRKTPQRDHPSLIEALAMLVNTTLPLAEYAVSDQFTAEDREKLRELVGHDGVPRLSRLMTQLTSEGARRAIAKQQ